MKSEKRLDIVWGRMQCNIALQLPWLSPHRTPRQATPERFKVDLPMVKPSDREAVTSVQEFETDDVFHDRQGQTRVIRYAKGA